MRTFLYRGYDADGKPCRGLVEADTVKDARRLLSERSILAERVAATGRSQRFTVGERAMFYRELAALLESGMPLLQAIDMTLESVTVPRLRSLIAGVRDRVREGAGLSTALRAASRTVGESELAILEAAEKAATMESMLEQLGQFLEAQQEVRERISNALIYPLLVVTMGIVVAMVMLGVLLPRMQGLLGDSLDDLPGLTAFMLGLGHIVQRWWWTVIIAVAGGVVLVRAAWQRDEVRVRWSRVACRGRFVGHGVRLVIQLRFTRTFGILLRGGVGPIDALALAGRATGNAWVAKLAEEQAERVKHGDRLSEACARIPPLAEGLPGWIRIGEASGGLPRLMASAARRYEGLWDRYVDRGLKLMEPALILAIGGFVLLIALSVLLPVFRLTSTVGVGQ